ncbi:MAG: CdaR family protein [Eubacteriales bacterium]|nr:CdaR family protein [Eubacteriales bacterium]
MLKKIWSSLEREVWLKLLSVVIAIVIWYGVVSINDPTETQSYNVKITVANESYITSGSQVYSIDDQNKTVSVSITDNRSKLKNLKAESITVRADLTQIVDMNRDPIMVPLSVTCTGIAQSNIRLAKNAIPINIENIASRQFAVGVDVGESKPGDGYEIGTRRPDPEQLVIRGPESIINEIDTVTAQIDVTGMTMDGQKSAKLIIRRKDGSTLSDETIEDDLTFGGNVQNVSVYVDLWKVRSSVGFDIEYAGEPADGYHISEVTSMPETIMVVGTDEALAALAENGNKITVPEHLISVEGATNTVDMDINLNDILPDGLRLASGIAEGLTASVNILPDESKKLTLNVNSIELKNLDESLNITYDGTSIEVVVRGDEESVRNVTAADLKASIDFNGLKEGDHKLPLTVSMPSGLSLYDSVLVSVHLTKIPAETKAPENTETGN